ncbi:hypothetical protein [Novosphingobium humi]|uniref:hypothetical protein n=1 Tax=Novosphingobium humi TaxID=2282397 RepID=UPI003081148E
MTLPEFRHALFAMSLSMFAGSAFYGEHKALLDAHGLDLIGVADTFASVFSSGE